MEPKENPERRRPVKKRLTDRVIRAIEPPEKGVSFVYDTEVPFFGLRTLASATKAFIYGYRNQDGRLHRVTLGRWPTLTATAARLRAREIAGKVATGKDPHEERQRRKTKLTAERLVDLFVASYLPTKKRGAEMELYLRRDFLPFVGPNAKAEDVRRRDIVVILNDKAAHAPIAANRLLEVVRRLYNWALEQDLIESTPCVKVKRPAVERTRDRVLSEDEIRLFWERLETTKRMSAGVRVALKLILLLGQRPGEIVGMASSELDLKRGCWELPREKTKSDRAHRVPLPSMAVELIEQRPRGDRWVFPSVKEQPIKVLALSHAVRYNRHHFGIEDFRPHDLRRTCASHLAAVGVDRFIIERILNHADRSIGGVYDRYGYDKQKKSALERWERKLRSIIGKPLKGKVVSIG